MNGGLISPQLKVSLSRTLMCLAPSLTRGKEAKRKKMAECRSQRRLAVPCVSREGTLACLLLLVSKAPAGWQTRLFEQIASAHPPVTRYHTTAIRIWRCDTTRCSTSQNIETQNEVSGTPDRQFSKKITQGSVLIPRDPLYNKGWWLWRLSCLRALCENELNKWGCPWRECGSRNKI